MPKPSTSKPEMGEFAGTIIDVINLGKVKSQWRETVQLRVVWVLGFPDGSGRYATNSEGKPYRVTQQVNASIDPKSKLYQLAKDVLGTAPSIPFETETLMGRSNRLFIEKSIDSRTGKTYANIRFISFLPKGHVPPPVPPDYIRAKGKPKEAVATKDLHAITLACHRSESEADG